MEYWEERIPKQKKRIITRLESLGDTSILPNIKNCKKNLPCNDYVFCPKCQIIKQSEDILFIRKNLKKYFVQSISFITFKSKIVTLKEIPELYNKILSMWNNLYKSTWFNNITEGWFRSFIIENVDKNLWRIIFNIGFTHNNYFLGAFNKKEFLIQKFISVLNEKNVLTVKNYELDIKYRSDQIALFMNYTIPILWKDLVVKSTDDEFKFFILHMRNYLSFNYSYGGIFSNKKWNDSVTDFLLLNNKEK